jgi:benzoyl-CoA reductase/2-hydroxyglutaryl-CoA dehydratase subunit BcrC/BadD/HgdB
MNFYEEQIIKLERRIKKIEENPDPTKPKSNKIRYQRELEFAKEQLEGWRQGRPFSDGGSGLAGTLTAAMGFLAVGSVEPAFQTAHPQKYLEQARDKGLPVDRSCDMTMMPFAMMECGDTPMEDLAFCASHGCTPMILRQIYVKHQSGTLSYNLDLGGYEENEANFKYVLEQFKEFIEFAEKRFPGLIKYDEDKLGEFQENSDRIHEIDQEVQKMIVKHKPTPIAGKDTMGGPRGTNRWGTTKLDVEYALARRDEIAERIEKGIAAVPGEKLRVLWTGVTNPVFMDPYKVLAKWGIATFRGGVRFREREFGRTDEGRAFWRAYWGDKKPNPLERFVIGKVGRLSTAAPYVNNIIEAARDLEVDGIVNYNMRGCTVVLGYRKLLEEAAEKELGIPVLQLEGAQWDSGWRSEAQISADLDEFAQMLLSMKGYL